MAIDIQTFSLVLGITHMIQILVFFYQYKANKDMMGPGWWLLWSLSETIGFMLIVLRKIPLFLPYAIVFQDLFIVGGALFIYIGINSFFEKKVNIKFVIPFFVSFAFLHLYYYWVLDDLEIRALLFGIYMAVLAFISAISLYRLKLKAVSLTANFNIAIFIVHGLVFTFRAVKILSGASAADFFAPTFFNFLPYFDALIVSLLWTFGFIMLINQRLHAEITEAKLHFELIFNTSPDASIITRQRDGLLIDCNESFTRVTGYSKEDISARSTLDIEFWNHPEERAAFITLVNKKGSTDNFETSLRRKSGQVFTALISAKTLMLHNEPHLISVTRDITERKLAEEEIKKKNEELKKLNTEKDKFFSIIAHDLRGPLGIFLGLTEMMIESLNDLKLPAVKEYANAMRDTSVNLFKLLENLLEWSRMEMGAISFNPVKVDLQDLIKESMMTVLEPAKAKEIHITCNIANNFEIFADKNILQTVIRNLASNAVKFTPRDGKIEIFAVLDESKSVTISVRDSGIGMSREIIDNLFNLNNQTNRKGTEDEASTGLGLFLCKNLIKKHGGNIWVESKEGEGSVFTFTIPHNNAT